MQREDQPRREVVADALRLCPDDQWIDIDELFGIMRTEGPPFRIARSEGALWRLYLEHREYGSLGYSGYHDWPIVEGRYALAVLFEYAATLGLIDVEIAKCHMDLETTLGDVRSLDPVRAIRDDGVGIQNLLADDKVGCRDCSWRNWCAGGCAVATFRATRPLRRPIAQLEHLQDDLPEALLLEARRVHKYAAPSTL